MSFLISILPAIAVLAVLIVVHEFGHFLACRAVGVKVDKFSVGFGPEILHWQGKETRYAISLVPLGGFVKPAGETIGEIDDRVPKSGHYLHAPIWQRIIIVTAGVAMNYVLAFVLFVVLYVGGSPVTGTTIGSFMEGYPASQSGLQKGDRIVQINETEVRSWPDLTTVIHKAPSAQIVLHVQRGDQILTIPIEAKVESVKDYFGEEHQIKRLGVIPHPEAVYFERYGFLEAIKRAWNAEVFITTMTHKAIFYLMMGKLSAETISGPIRIVSLTGDAAKMGLPYVLQLMAVLSISLAVINLLPVPALDGGHLLFLLIEAFTRKRVSLIVQERAAQVGFMLLLGLMVFVVYNDLVHVGIVEKVKSIFSSF